MADGLDRFVAAQDPVYAGVLEELRRGRKTGHWMWFIFPQVAGLRLTFACNGAVPVDIEMWKSPEGPGGPETPIGPADTVRLVTNDFMYGGGDGYTALADATDVLQPGDDLMELTVEYITANSPVDPQVEGRITGP